MGVQDRCLSCLPLLLCLVLLCSSVYSSTLRDKSTCGRPLCEKPLNFKFSPELKYSYKYEAEVNTVFDVEKHNASTLSINGHFDFYFPTPCHGELEVKELSILDRKGVVGEDSDESNNIDSFSKHILRFYYQDGLFQEICPDKDEPVWVLNFKKGLLSAFQNSMERLDLDHHGFETDVNGECLTHYRLEAVNGTTLIISKHKTLSTCGNRHQLHSITPTSNYVFQTKYHKWSPMVSDLSCKQFVDHSVITSVECSESHSFLPFYNQTLGASTYTRFNISLIEEEGFYRKSSKNEDKTILRRTSLLYDTKKFIRELNQSVEETRALVVSMCNMNTEELQPEFSEVFNKFIHIARYLPYDSVSQLYKGSDLLCSSGKKHVMDGLPHLRSSASIEVMKDIIVTEDIPQTTISQFLFSMSLYNRPDAETIRAVAPLVLEKSPEVKTYLAVTSLIHSYCKMHPSCETNNYIQSIVARIEELIHQNIFPDDQLELIIGALKALGNAGVQTPTLVKSLQKVVTRWDLPLELRIAAVSAHRRLPCGGNQDFLILMYQNQTNEEEIRIKSYLEAIKCPSHQNIQAIKDTLALEENNQVGSFVWSHLHNLKVSALPTRMVIQAMLQNTEFSTKFNKPYLKFSRNYESSFYINEYGVGGFVVSNVIFSPKSYIPRSVSSNITLLLFGETVNVAEVTLDLEGFEQYVEALFWNNGILSKFEKTLGILRFLRSSPSTMRTKIDALNNVIADSFAVPKASLSIRMFGNEIQYYRVSEKEEINKLLNDLNPVKIVKDFLSGQEIKIEKSMLLCDARYVTPLAIGFSLNTDAIITSTVKLDLAGFFNNTAFMSDGQFSLDGKLKPSVAVNMVGSMSVDAYYTKSEVKVNSKIYTSTAVAGNVKLRSYKYAWISLNLPLKKSEIFSGSNQLVIVQEGKEVQLQGLISGRADTKICSWPIIDDALGLTLCVKSLLPNSTLVLDSPLLIFNGPLNIDVTLDKSDPSTQVYTLEYNMTDLAVREYTYTLRLPGDKRVISVNFDTPGSTVKRGLQATINLDKEGPNVTLVFQTTRTQLRAQGFYKNTPEELALSFWMDMNGKKYIDLQLALYVEQMKHGLTYKPKLQFLINDKRVAELSGSYQWIEKNEISQCEILLDFRTNRFSTAITGYVRSNNVSISTNLKLDYQFESAKQEYIKLEVLFADRSAQQISKVFGNLTLLSSAYPQINTVIHLNYQKGHGHLDCKALIKTNPGGLVDLNYKLVIRTGFTYFRTHNGSKAELLIEIKKSDDDIDLKFSVTGYLRSGAITLNSLVRYSKGKEITMAFDLNVPKGSLLLIDSKLKVTIPNTVDAMVIHGVLHEKKASDYDIDFVAIWFSGHNLTVKGSYEDQSTFEASVHLLKLLAKSQLFQDTLFNGKLLIGDKEYRTNLTVDYSDVVYGLTLNHVSQNPAVMVSNGALSFSQSSYTLSNFIDMVKRQASFELHLDHYRDIHINVQGPQSPTEVKAMLDIKWDANRDPMQKFMFMIEGIKIKHLNYEVTSIMEYPGRAIKASASIQNQESNYKGLLTLEWSAQSAISVSSLLVLDLQRSGTVSFSSIILTPFENWKETNLKYGLWILENSMKSNGSVTWGHNGSVIADIMYETLTSDTQVGFAITTVLNSTVKEISPLNGQLSYTQSAHHISTLLDIASSSVHRIRLESTGEIVKNSSLTNYLGVIRFKTPFQNLTSGELSANFNMDSNQSFVGGSVVAFNDRNITVYFEGAAKTINESRLWLSIYTPFQRYKKINGKVTFSASKSQLLAELKATAFTLGFKTIYMFKSMQDFDLQLSATTGVNFVSSLLLVGTLNNETVDFRGGWNNVLVGLTARSHYLSWYDLEYRGSLYMPFENFRESGAVAKFTFTDRLHLEVSAAVAKAKVGLKLLSMHHPDEDFAVSGSDYCAGESSSKNSSVLWRALFDLDTLYYPTATAHIEVAHFDHFFYATTAKAQFNVINICVQDQFTFKEYLSIANDLTVSSSHPMMSEMQSKFELSGNWPLVTTVDMDLKAIVNNHTYKFDMEGNYYYSALGSTDNEGIYSLNYRLSTPFEALDHCYFDFNLQAEKQFFASNMTIDVVDNRINMYGTLDVDDNYFSLMTDFSVSSPSFTLPFCHLTFTKDLSGVEKTVTIILRYPNKIGEAESFEVSTLWHFGGERYIKLSGNVVTPFEKLSKVQASFLYSSEPSDKEYNLEIFLKQSHQMEGKLIGKIVKEKLDLLIESSLQQFREIVVNGTLKRLESGALNLDSVISVDQTICMDLEITSTDGVPLIMNVRMTDNRRPHDKELMTVAVDLRRKRFVGAVGYDLLTVIQSGLLNIQVASEITTKPTEENWSFSVISNHSQYKEVGLKIIVIPGKDQIFEINIRGHIDAAALKADFDMICNMWFDGKKGRVKAKLDSYPLSGDSYLEWEWDYLRNMKGLANASYDFYNVSRDFSSLMFFRSTPSSLDNVCLGTDISFNNKLWWFNTNVTLMAPSLNDVAFTSFLLLPHNVKEVHSLVGKMHFTKDYKYINQVLKYSTVLSKMGLQTSVQMKMTNGAVDGSIFLEGGVNGAHFLRDDFNATIKNNKCDINSVFTSSFTNDDITVGLHYKKPHVEHKITVDLYSPSHEVMVLAMVDFETIHNMHTNITCTTPISTFPQIGMTLRAITNQTVFYRFGSLLWPNNSAMFNYTHLRSLLEEAGASINDGRLLVDFPLATRHTILLTYKYQEYQMSSNGLSGLIYNNNSILQGNFSRQQLISDLELGDIIKINVTNIYMPLGLHYQHKRKKNVNNPSNLYTDKKRIEIFRAGTPSLGIAGEVQVDRTEQDNTVELNLAHSNRNLKLKTVFCVNNTLYSEAHVYLKPTVWVSSNFFLFRKHTNEESKERLNFVLSYPRRNVSVTGAYQWAGDELDCYLTLEPGSNSHPITVLMAWAAQDPLSQKAVVLLSHPSLEKNLTVNAHMKQRENVILDVDVELDYALLPQRKLSFHGSLVSKPKKNEKNYELLISAKHPITRLHVDSSGVLIRRQGYLLAIKNVSYERAFLPLQFWNSSVKLDLNNKEAQMKRQSLRDLAFVRAKYSKQGSKYNLEGNIIKGKTTNITGSGYLDPFNFKSSATVNLTSDASEQLLVDGDFVDNRHAYWNVWRKYDDLSINDMSFSLRLNHSRLLTSSYIWRTSMKQDLVEGFHSACNYLWTYMTETGDFWTDFIRTEVSDTMSDIWLDAEPNLQEFIDDITNIEMLKSDIVYFQTVFNESYEANEFFMQDIYNISLILAEEIAFRDKMGDLPKIVSELWQVMGETGESVRQSILYLIETVKNMYMKAVAVCSELLQGNALQNFSQLIGRLSSKYDKMIKDLHVTFINYVELLWTQVATTITDAWNRMLQVIEPAFIEFVHYTDSLFWDFSKKILEFLYQKQSFILSSANLAKDSNFTKDLDKFYKDFTKNGLLTSTKKYTIMLFGMVKEKYFKVVPFGYELTEITSEIYDEIKELYKLPAINFTIDATIAIYEKTVWLYGYFDVGHKIQQALPFVYHKAIDLSHTALQNEIINHQRKTKFVFEPRRGELYLEQLLPMPWHSFNRIPNFEEIKEYKMITDIQKWLTPSNRTFWSLYYEYSPLLDYHNWLPPYKGEAMIGKNHHYITFDKKHYSFRSPCSYLLAKDFVRNDFALILKYTNGKHTIDLYIGPYIVEIDLDSDVVNILSHPMSVPANLNGTFVYYEFGMIKIESDMGFSIECNTKHDVCLIKLSGWYFGKTAGLLGTLDNEPSNDFMMATGEVTKDPLKFTLSWLLDSSSGKCTTHLPAQRRTVSPSLKDKCDDFFASKTSQFSTCFAIVDPEPYKAQCHSSLSDIDNDICTSAIMYIQECSARNIPLRTPNSCVKCQLYTNVQMGEGDFTKLKGPAITQSSDVVFIIEAKKCNNYSTRKKSMPMIVNSIAKELIETGLTNNRFSMVVFGGDGVFERPRSMLVNNEVFSSAKYVTPIFTQIPIGNGRSDILMALRFSTKLKFRPGVSKTFVLIPCSLCESNDTSFDYSVLQEVLIEKDVTLHIIMSNDFGLEKARSNRILYGVDANTAFTKNDFKKLKGDKDLRRQVKQAKHLFGYCSHIALDSNGTVFSASKLENLNMNPAKKFVNVFAKRVASSAKPSDCLNCECTADENGIDTIDCSLCVYPTPIFRDFEFKDNSTLFKSFEDDLDNFGNDNL